VGKPKPLTDVPQRQFALPQALTTLSDTSARQSENGKYERTELDSDRVVEASAGSDSRGYVQYALFAACGDLDGAQTNGMRLFGSLCTRVM
jgi:hypothetical protein